MASKDFKLPDLGEGVHEGQIVRVMIKPGETVREDQPLLEVETDKAAVVIPSPYSGVVEAVHVRDGQLVHVGEVMVTIGDAGAARGSTAVARPRSGAHEREARSPAARALTPPAATAEDRTRGPAPRRKAASPAVRKLARSVGIDIETISGTGPGGRVQRADVQVAAEEPRLQAPRAGRPAAALPSARTPPSPAQRPVAARIAYPPIPESQVVEPQGERGRDAHGDIRRAPLSQARKTIAGVMANSWATIPHATDFDDADVTELDRLRRGYTAPDDPSRKITMLAFVVRAVVRALQRFPEFNASIDLERNEIIYKRYLNIAVGVHTDRGLVPMVVRDADRLTIPQISDELHVMGEKARAATFGVNDTRGGTYTISNAGAMGGSRYSTPIISPPQVAVLAIGRTRWMPWVIEQENGSRGLAPRLILPLSHSIDHRLLDGGQEVQYLQQIIADLQNPARLLL